MLLHDYWRSTAGYRVRIALALKGVVYDRAAHDLRTGAQATSDYRALNPQKLVPALQLEETILIQSGAILEWLDEVYPAPPLLPLQPTSRAIVRGMAACVVADIHPINNLRVLSRLRSEFGADDARVKDWIAHWITEGFTALEVLIAHHGAGFAFGNRPTLADCCLIPQVYSAERFKVDLTPYPALMAVAARASRLEAFQAAHPSRQADADPT